MLQNIIYPVQKLVGTIDTRQENEVADQLARKGCPLCTADPERFCGSAKGKFEYLGLQPKEILAMPSCLQL